jgi:hypothetical protein
VTSSTQTWWYGKEIPDRPDSVEEEHWGWFLRHVQQKESLNQIARTEGVPIGRVNKYVTHAFLDAIKAYRRVNPPELNALLAQIITDACHDTDYVYDAGEMVLRALDEAGYKIVRKPE